LKETLKFLLVAKRLLAQVVSSGKDVIFVGTKRQAQEAIEQVANKCGMHYVSHRWLGGTLTNFRTIRSRVQRLEQLEAMQQEGEFDSESKKRAAKLKSELRKIKANLEGIRNMSRMPGGLVVVDANKEHIALREARKLQIPAIGIIDTDSDPDMVDVAIPANDDSIRAVELILGELAEAVGVGKTMVPDRQGPVRPTRRARSRRPALARADEDQGPGPVGTAQTAESDSQQLKVEEPGPGQSGS